MTEECRGPELPDSLKFLLVEKGFAPLVAGDLADQLKDALDVMMEGIYLVTKVLGGEVSYTYTTKAEHQVLMTLTAS